MRFPALSWPGRLLQDLRAAARMPGRSPGFAAAAIATLSLAIGANTAMFGVVYGLFVRPLPYPDQERIVRVLGRQAGGGLTGLSTLDFLDLAAQTDVFDRIAAEAGWRATVQSGTEPVVIRGARASASYFDIFGSQLALGRTFRPDEDQPGRDRVVLLSHRLWTRHFAADPELVGRPIVVDGAAYTVVGILKAGGPFDRASAQIWAPLAFQPSQMTRDYRWLSANARLKPDVTLAEARAAMDILARRMAEAYPDSHANRAIAVDRLGDVLVGPDLRSAISMLFAATGFVLLIGCANLANLSLARGVSRTREMTVRTALGARRWHLVQQVVIENLALAVCGALGGLGTAYALLGWITSLMPPDALPPAVDFSLDTAALTFTVIIAIGAALFFSLAPAAEAASPHLLETLKDGGSGTTPGARGRGLRHGLVVAEVALAFVLLVASGLTLRSLIRLLDTDPGFETANVLTAGVPVSPEQHPDPVELNLYLDAIRASVQAVPGVRDSALASVLPLQGWGFGVPYAIAGRAPADTSNRTTAFFKIITPSYFATLGIPRRAGRWLAPADGRGAPPALLINETLARREFPDDDPVGHVLLAPQLVPGTAGFGEQVAWTIVGVVGDEKVTGLGDAFSAGMYATVQQSPTYAIELIVRTDTPASQAQDGIVAAVRRVNRSQALSDVRPLDALVAQSVLGNRVITQLFGGFAAMALLLAAVGVHGVIAHAAAQRTRELGIRAALGASRRDLRLLIVRMGMRLVLMGLVLGVGGALAVTRLLTLLLYDISALDPLTMGAASGVVVGVAGLSCLAPAWRVTRGDPLVALRRE